MNRGEYIEKVNRHNPAQWLQWVAKLNSFSSRFFLDVVAIGNGIGTVLDATSPEFKLLVALAFSVSKWDPRYLSNSEEEKITEDLLDKLESDIVLEAVQYESRISWCSCGLCNYYSIMRHGDLVRRFHCSSLCPLAMCWQKCTKHDTHYYRYAEDKDSRAKYDMHLTLLECYGLEYKSLQDKGVL